MSFFPSVLHYKFSTIVVEWQSIKKFLLLLLLLLCRYQFRFFLFIFHPEHTFTINYDEWLLIVCSLWSGNCELTRKFHSMWVGWMRKIEIARRCEWMKRKCKLGWMNCSCVCRNQFLYSFNSCEMDFFVWTFFQWEFSWIEKF